MKLYKVKATKSWEYVIEVAEGEDPQAVANKVVNSSEEYDCKGVFTKVGPEIKTKAGLPRGWDISCLPWGTDLINRNESISSVLEGN